MALRAVFSVRGFSPNPNLRYGFMVQNPLRIGHFNAVFLESPPYTHEELAFDSRKAVLRIVDPHSQLEIDCIVPEARQQAGGFGVP